MPYDPNAPSQEQRDRAYRGVWAGLISSIALLVLICIDFSGLMKTMTIALVCGSMIGAASPFRIDDYFEELQRTGFRWAIGILALWLSIYMVLSIGDIGHSLGFGLASGSSAPLSEPRMPFRLLASAEFVVACASLAFHAGFLFQQFRT
jgi:hypothetical protein